MKAVMFIIIFLLIIVFVICLPVLILAYLLSEMFDIFSNDDCMTNEYYDLPPDTTMDSDGIKWGDGQW